MKSMGNSLGEGKRALISFIILTYCDFSGIYATLDSVFAQDYPQIELIISDDCSPNSNIEISRIKEYVRENKTNNIVNVIFREGNENVGTVRNLNLAILLSNGEYIKDLGAGDTLVDGYALSKYKKFLDDSGQLICCSKLQGMTEDGKIKYRLSSCEDNYTKLRSLSPIELRNRLFVRNCLPSPAFFMKRKLFLQYGLYLERVRLIEDYPYWIHLCNEGVSIAFFDERLVNYRLNGISSSERYTRRFMEDMIIIYDEFIFPFDRRFGIFQKPYNLLKKGGLKAYIALSEWDEVDTHTKIKKLFAYGPFFVYIWLRNLRYR